MQSSINYSVAQLIAILVSAAALLTQPHLAQLVVLFISFSMAFSMGCALSVGYYYSSRGIEKISRDHACLLGTQFGGILCYLIMICKAFEHIR
ncbi:MAG: hypothetical protein AMJ53_12235 [Gammaproteobacteria bacterium SG8_11]|nr:MAG: hypothetical protein AMJ53_12235 [Gammaproteobacteria bacterium SG8_11]